ncbi:MAG: hypothetical protein EU532_02525 [Promethearchaeota archaeon]|nr:MAG: hypothetical protein EU532_02525 [Candidatus Lokiarchaeota archaeon]
MTFKERFFFDEDNPDWIQKTVFIIIIWYIIDVIIFFLLGFMNILNTLAASNLVFLLLITSFLFKFVRQNEQFQGKIKYLYLPTIFILAIIEETIVYYSGGGLQGAAVSLWHDLALSIPVFLMIGIGILITNRIKPMNSGEIFLLGLICGIIMEIILPGHFFNIILIFLFVGAGAGFYSILYTALAPIPDMVLEHTKVQTLTILLIGTIICLICMVIAGIIGTTLYNSTTT